MFEILKDKTICLTRGDIANIVVSASLQDGAPYTFHAGDVVRFRVTKKRDLASVLIQKDITIDEEVQSVTIRFSKDDTRFAESTNSPVDYWYEIEVNPDTEPQTIIGYDSEGAKIFRLYPEGGDA